MAYDSGVATPLPGVSVQARVYLALPPTVTRTFVSGRAYDFNIGKIQWVLEP
jgi:hypothetical protein